VIERPWSVACECAKEELAVGELSKQSVFRHRDASSVVGRLGLGEGFIGRSYLQIVGIWRCVEPFMR
jgi:hypothetical protein